MKKVDVSLRHCYGIKRLDYEFDFSKKSAFAVYAPNGVMKSSFAQTFADISEGKESRDRIFTDRATTRHVVDEDGKELLPDEVLVLLPYNVEFGSSERTSTLLVNNELRREYTALFEPVYTARDRILTAIGKTGKSKRNFDEEISRAFSNAPDQLFRALLRVENEVYEQADAPFADVQYEKIFTDKVMSAIEKGDLKNAILDYINRYNELLDKSTYFKKGLFDYYNASQIATVLTKNGFFKASHDIRLRGPDGNFREIKSEADLTAIVQTEKDELLKDAALTAKFDQVSKLLDANAELRDFKSYLMDSPHILSRMDNPALLRDDVLKSYLKVHESDLRGLLDAYRAAEVRRREIEAEAERQRTQWEEVIDIFNRRFFVPFKLEAKNRVAVMLGGSGIIKLGFKYLDGDEVKDVDRECLLETLSTGEKKALYILNVIFEVQARIKAGQATLFIVDDIADSFDYHNKYAIIQYLKDIKEEGIFKQIILTHNFDFFRTVESRFVGYKQCLMAKKTDDGIVLIQASAIRNVFANDWKIHFSDDDCKRVACIPFLRNLVEFSKGEADPDFQLLTKALHWRPGVDGTAELTIAALGSAFTRITGIVTPVSEMEGIYPDLLAAAAQQSMDEGADDLEDKVVLAIAARIEAEQFMITAIADDAFVMGITASQTQALIQRFKKDFPGRVAEISILDRVGLMTPENIHLNSFMYEPLIDMSVTHLKQLLTDVRTLE